MYNSIYSSRLDYDQFNGYQLCGDNYEVYTKVECYDYKSYSSSTSSSYSSSYSSANYGSSGSSSYVSYSSGGYHYYDGTNFMGTEMVNAVGFYNPDSLGISNVYANSDCPTCGELIILLDFFCEQKGFDGATGNYDFKNYKMTQNAVCLSYFDASYLDQPEISFGDCYTADTNYLITTVECHSGEYGAYGSSTSSTSSANNYNNYGSSGSSANNYNNYGSSGSSANNYNNYGSSGSSANNYNNYGSSGSSTSSASTYYAYSSDMYNPNGFDQYTVGTQDLWGTRGHVLGVTANGWEGYTEWDYKYLKPSELNEEKASWLCDQYNNLLDPSWGGDGSGRRLVSYTGYYEVGLRPGKLKDVYCIDTEFGVYLCGQSERYISVYRLFL